jgi:hypothetical protein
MAERISLLLPTRQRPENFTRMYESAFGTADHPELLEVVCYIDEDDNSYDSIDFYNLTKVRGSREYDGIANLSIMWNKCWENATGDIFMHCGDDIVFRTQGWDTAVREAINARPGKICFAWCNDVSPESNRNEFGTHGFVHRNWTDVVGRFVPPYFASDYNDTWFNDVARALGVTTYLDNYLTEHMHYSLGKSEIDQNTKERLDRHASQKPDQIYNSEAMQQERQEEIEKLRKFISGVKK